MALTIKWSRAADKKYDKILNHLEQGWGEAVTRVFVKKTYDLLEIISEFPEIGTLEKPDRNIRGFVMVKQITMFYKVKADKIIILNFYDNRQNPKPKRYSRNTLMI